MKRHGAAGVLPAGYTIIEVMIVMAVTGALFVSVALLLSGKQATAEFNQAVRDYESKIQGMASDVSSGYYDSGTFNCSVFGVAAPSFSNFGPIEKAGANKDCIFLGKIMSNGQSSGDIFTLIGRRIKAPPLTGDVEVLDDAKPVAVAPPSSPFDITQTYQYKYGLQITEVSTISVTPVDVGAFGFIPELGGGAGAATPVTGSRGVLLYRLDTSAAPNSDPPATTVGKINNTTNLKKVPEGIRICFSDGGNRRGEITIGADNSQTATFVTVDNGVSAICA